MGIRRCLSIMREISRRGILHVFLVLTVIVPACELEIDTLEVRACTPLNGATGVAADTAVEVRFSSDVNRADAESLFCLKYGEGVIEGRFTWPAGSCFRFSPVSRLDKNGRYVITVPRRIRDTKGNMMGSDFISDFYIGSDFVNPRVESSVPALTGGTTTDVPVAQNIIINFTKSMNRDSTQAAFSISPEPSGYFQWSEAVAGLADSRLTFVLTRPMEYGRLYKISVNAEAEDSSGNRLGTAYRVNFVTGNDFTSPAVDRMLYVDGDPSTPDVLSTSQVNSRVSKTGAIRVEFTKDMDRQSVEKAISITPSVQVAYDWLSDRDINVKPSVSFEPETVYQLAVETSCMDLNGHTLISRYAVEFRTDAADSLLVKTGSVSGSNNNAGPWTVFGPSWPVDIDMGGGTNNRYYIRIRFVSSDDGTIPGGMNTYSIFDNCIIETFKTTNGTGKLHDPAVISDISWQDDSTAVIQLSGMTNIATDRPALYRLTIQGGKSGIKDTGGNYMKDDYVVEFMEVGP